MSVTPRSVVSDDDTVPIRVGDGDDARTAVWVPRARVCRCCGEPIGGERWCDYCGRELSRVTPPR